MAAANYDEALRRLLVHEGGYTHHPSDPGGPTNFGITIHDYRKYIKASATAADVRMMRLADAKAIYKSKYWDAQRCDELPSGVDYAVFDYGVNSGIGRSAKVLQRVCGLDVIDGRIGPKTLAYVKVRDPATVVRAICDERLAFLQRLRTWPVFGKGWGRRVAECRYVALQMAAAAPSQPTKLPPALDPAGPTPGKAEIPKPKKQDEVIVGGGTTAGGAAGATWWDWVQAHPAETALIAIVIVGAIVGAVYLINQQRKKRQETPMPGTRVVPALKPA